MVNIIQDFIPAGRRNRPGAKMKPKYITIHDTGNTNPSADALSHAKYLKGDSAANAPVSWHFTVDDKQIVQHLPIDEIGYHAGDGKGPGNMSSIGVEICEGCDRVKAEALAAELVAKLEKETGAEVVQHFKWTGKNCPKVIRARPNGWKNFLKAVSSGGEYKMKPEDADKIIGILGAIYNFVGDSKEKTEVNRLANELRKASGQPTK